MPEPEISAELDEVIRARYAIQNLADNASKTIIRRLLAEREFALRSLLDQPHLLDPARDSASEDLGDGNYHRRRLPSCP